ncbi:MAG: HEPN domain-containing protein, partial [Lachnospiraceae bacterium]|nr:HEPN domain-containing protein [Lachnospiraceae bacterium]
MKPHETGNRSDLIEHRFCIAEEDLETAHLLLDAKQYRGANNRAYYSIYHTIDAILSIDEIAFKRHKDTLAYFNKQY